MCDVQEEVELLWGLMSYDDLSSCHEATFDTMNDIELIHWKETDTYSIFIEEAYVFKTPAEELRYLTALETALTAWMKEQGYRTDTQPEPPIETKGHFRSVEAAYADFIARVKAESNPYPVGPGWWPLLDETVEKLRAMDPEVQLMFKKKYGTCQIDYITESSEHFNEIAKLTGDAEEASKQICEFCGRPGQLQKERGWLQTLCDQCAALDPPERRKVAQEAKDRYFRRDK